MWKCLRAITREITESERGKGWFKRERGGKVREIQNYFKDFGNKWNKGNVVKMENLGVRSYFPIFIIGNFKHF